MGNLTKSRFSKLEQTIETGLQTFYEVGSALKEIRDSRVYKSLADYKTFEGYCRERWGMSRRNADRLIGSEELRATLTPIGLIPSNEAQARPLTALPPDDQREVWQTVLKNAPETSKGTKLITAKLVTSTVKAFLGDGKPDDLHEPDEFDRGKAEDRLCDWLRAELDRWPVKYRSGAAHWIRQIVEKEFGL